jgi:hypothetical protein
MEMPHYYLHFYEVIDAAYEIQSTVHMVTSVKWEEDVWQKKLGM